MTQVSFSLVRLILSFCFSTIVVSNSLAEDNRTITDFLHKSEIVEGFLGATKPSTAAYIDDCSERRRVSTTKSPTRLTYAGSLIKDYGIRGHTFPIIEQSLLEVIMTKLTLAKQKGLLEKMQDEFKEKVKEKVARPTAILGLHKATKDRSWTYDPTFTQKTSIKDQNGRIIVPASTNVNPLDSLAWGKPLILIDGDDQSQVVWAKSQQGIIVLINGSPMELGKKLGQNIYFDQGGMLIERFKIEAVPAIVVQDGKRLRIKEININ